MDASLRTFEGGVSLGRGVNQGRGRTSTKGACTSAFCLQLKFCKTVIHPARTTTLSEPI